MSENRVFKINPDLFKITANKSRKKKPANVEPKIKMKTPTNKTIKQKQLLNFIRSHQEKKNSEPTEPIKTDFEETLEFIKQVAKTPPRPNSNLNSTIKNHTRPPTPTITGIPPPVYNAVETKYTPPPPPTYGCLRGGRLPLYKNHTFRKKDDISHNSPIQIAHPVPLNNPPKQFTPSHPAPSQSVLSKQFIQSMTEKMENIETAKPRPPKKRKRTTLRRYNVGRSKTAPKIAVLVSNRTIRNQITTKSQLLRQVPIQEIRKYLTKNGFIKVGSVAPNDVLRKMYESAIMMCGEIQNKNVNILLHNYLEG